MKRIIVLCFCLYTIYPLFSQKIPKDHEKIEEGLEKSLASVTDFNCAPKIEFINGYEEKVKLKDNQGLSFALWEYILKVKNNGDINAENFDTNFNNKDDDLFYVQFKYPGVDPNQNIVALDLKSISPDGT